MQSGGVGGPCGACKLLRKKCVKGYCVFAPYFEADERGRADFEAVHRVFGAKNVANLLLRTPANNRTHAVLTLSYEAFSRITDPVYGCVAHLFNLHQQVENLQAQLAYVQARLSILKEKDRRSFCQSPKTNHLLMLSSTSTSTSVAASSLTLTTTTAAAVGQSSLDTCTQDYNNNVSFGEPLMLDQVDHVDILAQQLFTNHHSI